MYVCYITIIIGRNSYPLDRFTIILGQMANCELLKGHWLVFVLDCTARVWRIGIRSRNESVPRCAIRYLIAFLCFFAGASCQRGMGWCYFAEMVVL